MPPHLFSISDNAYTDMVQSKFNSLISINCVISRNAIEVYERSRASVKQSLRIYSHHTKVEAIAKISNNKQKYQEINDKYQGKTCFRCHFR